MFLVKVLCANRRAERGTHGPNTTDSSPAAGTEQSSKLEFFPLQAEGLNVNPHPRLIAFKRKGFMLWAS